MPPQRYPSDLSDEEWAILETVALVRRKARPSAEVAAKARRGRRLLPALRSGCSWRMLPKEYPTPWQTVYYHFRKRRIEGRLRRAHERLREVVREREGREPVPSAAVIDSQVVKTTPVGGPERGYDGAKRLSGARKRHILVDTGGLVLAARVHGGGPARSGRRETIARGR